MMSERLGTTICAVLACLAVAQGSVAQTRGPLFGPGVGDTGSRRDNRFDLTFGVHGGYDDSVAFERLEATDPTIQLGAYYGSFDAGLDVARKGRRVSFEADAGVSIQQFEKRDELSGFSGPTGFVGANLIVQVTSRTNVGLRQDFTSSPFFGFDVFGAPVFNTEGPLLSPDLSLDRAVVRQRTNTAMSTLTLTHALTQRSSIEMDYSLSVIDMAESFLGESYHSLAHHAGIQFRRALTPNTTMQLGYGYNQAPVSLVTGRHLGTSHDIQAGVDYRRPFRLARRTTFELGLGSNVVSNRAATGLDNRPDAIGSTIFGVVGHAQLSHQFSDRWFTSAIYDRGVEYSQAFAAPVFADSVELSLNGQLTRRLLWSTSATYSIGSVGFSGGRNAFDTLGATTLLQLGLTQHLALYTEYHYYRYEIGDDVLLRPGFERDLGRRGARLGLTAWVPLFGR